jgi:sortase A
MRNHRLTYPDIARLSGTTLISTGIGLLLFVFITITWGDPITGWQNMGQQDHLKSELHNEVDVPGEYTASTTSSLDPRLTRLLAASFRKSIHEGDAAGLMIIPKIHFRRYIVKGANPPDLAEGPGIYDQTGFPGSGDPVAIAGHRTTHGAPFLNIDQLKPGDLIYINMPYAKFTYEVTHTRIITPEDWSIVYVGQGEASKAAQQHVLSLWEHGLPCPHGTCEHLVMTACNPKYSAAQRIAVFSRLVEVNLKRGEH